MIKVMLFGDIITGQNASRYNVVMCAMFEWDGKPVPYRICNDIGLYNREMRFFSSGDIRPETAPVKKPEATAVTSSSGA